MEVSIVITCYNQEKYISRAIRSCLNQKYLKDEFEVVVVDDASTDSSLKIIEDFGNKITLVKNKKNLGLSKSRNIGIRKATGRYILNVDGDDFILKDSIYIETLFLNLNAHWGAVSCDYVLVDNDGIHISRLSGQNNPIACGIMFRKDALIKIGLYDGKMKSYEDKDLRYRFLKDNFIGHIELPLYRYRRHGSNMTSIAKEMRKYSQLLKKKIIKKNKNEKI